ncbi:MAG: hypothetical protein HY506_01910 [Candidatus Yanofskybacteria bacterium]|nr:hypothetical protein [Candidatus Yanofskybacteria bacterium]
MARVCDLKLIGQEDGLVKSTPTEETMKRIAKMRIASVKARNNSKISRMTRDALVYVVKWLRNNHDLSDDQIEKLSSEDLNRMPELIFAARGIQALSIGWIPLFGWVFAGKYILFKSRVKFLRSLDENIFDKANIEQAIIYSGIPDFF